MDFAVPEVGMPRKKLMLAALALLLVLPYRFPVRPET